MNKKLAQAAFLILEGARPTLTLVQKGSRTSYFPGNISLAFLSPCFQVNDTYRYGR